MFRTYARPPASWGGWLVAAAVVVVAFGVAGSVIAAREVARSDEQTSQRAFAATSANVVSHLQLAIQREQDLVVSVSAYIAATPNASNASFNRWAQADRTFARYPEMLGLVRIVLVPASKLPAFAARARIDPAGTLARDGSFQVVPAGKRPFYCFIELAAKTPVPGTPQPAGFDYCAGGAGVSILAARDSGQGAYQPYSVGQLTVLAVQTPIYRNGTLPTTVAARRAAFIGWIAVGLTPKLIVEAALAGQPRMAVKLGFASGSAAAAFRAGTMPRNARSLTEDLHNGWTVQTFAAAGARGVFSHTNAAVVLLGGIALSVLLGLLGFVLATGRARAVRHVHEQTVELRGQAATLRSTIADLEAAQAIKDEFIGLVSHELRTPLTSISGFTELLQDEELSDDQRQYLNVIASNAARLLAIVDDLLLMAQIQSGGVPLQVGEVLLDDLIARSGEAAKPFAASKEIEVNIEAEPGVATDGDQARLGQALDNLVSNAIKYTPNGGGVRITMTRTGETATIAVSDTGIGIPQDEQDKLFGRFFRTSNARASGAHGTGLGLAITRGIVEAHGGTIGFESVEGAGSTFRVTLPHAHRAELVASKN